MFKTLSISVLSAVLLLLGAKAASAETVLEKAARTGVLTVGVHLNQVPYSYVNDKDELVGYSLDIANLIRAELARELGKPIRLEAVEASDVFAAIPKLRAGEIDLACGVAFTWERDKYVDFTTSYAVTGIRLLVPQGSSIKSEDSMAGKRIAVIPKTIIEKTMKLVQPKAVLVPFANLTDGLMALKDGKVDGVAGDGILLDGQRQTIGLTNTNLVPEKAFMSYGVSCMVPENNSGLLRLANYAIVGLADGYLRGDKEATALVNRWIGPDGIAQVDPERVRAFFGYLLTTHEQVPPTPTAASVK